VSESRQGRSVEGQRRGELRCASEKKEPVWGEMRGHSRPDLCAASWASSFALRRARKSARQLECCTCSMRTWMRFLATRPPICEGEKAPRV